MLCMQRIASVVYKCAHPKQSKDNNTPFFGTSPSSAKTLKVSICDEEDLERLTVQTNFPGKQPEVSRQQGNHFSHQWRTNTVEYTIMERILCNG